MKKAVLLTTLFFLVLGINARTKKVNSLGVSVPIIWNNSYGVFYSLGSRKEPEGKSKSLGVNVSYNRTVYKNIFGIVGIGYLKQNFNIRRPFEFNSPTNLLFRTERYSYSIVGFDLGLGGLINMSKKFNFMPKFKYSHLSTFRQKNIVDKEFGTEQVNKLNFSLGNIFQSSFELNYNISNQLSLGVGIIIPLRVQWKNDDIFFRYNDIDDSQIIANNKSSLGSLITINYNLK